MTIFLPENVARSADAEVIIPQRLRVTSSRKLTGEPLHDRAFDAVGQAQSGYTNQITGGVVEVHHASTCPASWGADEHLPEEDLLA